MGLRYRRITRPPGRPADTPAPAESLGACAAGVLAFGISPEDDPPFVQIVASILDAVVADNAPEMVTVVQIDSWFDQKWLRFSGKTLGAVGVWKKDLTFPPFHPNRVKAQTALRRSESGQYAPCETNPLHLLQRSSENFNRKVTQGAESEVFAWWSSDTVANDRASVMVYALGDGQISAWYASFQQAEEWVLGRTREISTEVVRRMISRKG